MDDANIYQQEGALEEGRKHQREDQGTANEGRMDLDSVSEREDGHQRRGGDKVGDCDRAKGSCGD